MITKPLQENLVSGGLTLYLVNSKMEKKMQISRTTNKKTDHYESMVTCKEIREPQRENERNRGRREAADDSETGRSIEIFQLANAGSAEKRKPCR